MSENWRRGVTKSYSKSAIVKKKYSLRYLCGQERLSRISGLAQCITPAKVNLRAKDCDTHWVLKIALTIWAAHAGGRVLALFLEAGHVDKAYFSPWDLQDLGQSDANIEWRRSMREQAKEHAHQGPEPIVPIHELQPRLLKMPRLGSIRDLNPDMDISGTQLTERALSTPPSEEPGTVSGKSRFSIASDDDDDDDGATFEGEFSDFSDRYGAWRKWSSLDRQQVERALLCCASCKPMEKNG